ncbi:SPDEF family protein [Megaselia abdita]
MEFFNNYTFNNFCPNEFLSDDCGVKQFDGIYPSPSSSPTYESWMYDMYKIKIERVLPSDIYAAPPSPPDSCQSNASSKSVKYNCDNIFNDEKSLFVTIEQSSTAFNETDVNIEPIISMVLEEAKLDSKSICELLDISLNPNEWTKPNVQTWLSYTLSEFNITDRNNLTSQFEENGKFLTMLTEKDFLNRLGEIGEIIFAKLEILKMIFGGNQKKDDDKPKKIKAKDAMLKKNISGTHIHLWQFLKELLLTSDDSSNSIRWIDRNKGIFKIEDSVKVAKLWGKRKNRPAMNYDKLSRSIRQYYKKGIMRKTERSQRLVYQFCHPYYL